jgi:hypothetical protein
MSKIRETVITNCEKKFLIKCLSEWTVCINFQLMFSVDDFALLEVRWS